MHDQDEGVVRGRGAQQGEIGWKNWVFGLWLEMGSMERKVKMGTAVGLGGERNNYEGDYGLC